MTKKLGVRRNYISLNAVDPEDGKLWDVRIAHARIDSIAKRGQPHINELRWTVRGVLLKPTAIFRGVRSEGEDKWLCYVGRPTKSYRGPDGHEADPWPDEVFSVFVNDDRVAYQWFWCKCDDRNADLPEGFDKRFGCRLL